MARDTPDALTPIGSLDARPAAHCHGSGGVLQNDPGSG
jgi:hypothetical protein